MSEELEERVKHLEKQVSKLVEWRLRCFSSMEEKLEALAIQTTVSASEIPGRWVTKGNQLVWKKDQPKQGGD